MSNLQTNHLSSLVLDNPNWDNLRIPITSTNGSGSNAPTFTRIRNDGAGSQGVFAYSFNDTQEQELYFTCQLPHSWKEGSTLRPHLHIVPTTTTAGNAVWGLEYSFADISSVFPTTTLITTTYTVDNTAYKHQIVNLPTISGSGKRISSMLICRVFRTGNSGSDTYNASLFLLEIDFHIENNTIGSLQEFIKF